MEPLIILVVRLFNEVCSFAVVNLLGFDAEPAVQTLQSDIRSASCVEHVGKSLHFAMLINANELLIFQLVGIQRVELRSEVVIYGECISIGVNGTSKLFERCSHIHATVNQHIRARFDD